MNTTTATVYRVLNISTQTESNEYPEATKSLRWEVNPGAGFVSVVDTCGAQYLCALPQMSIEKFCDVMCVMPSELFRHIILGRHIERILDEIRNRLKALVHYVSGYSNEQYEADIRSFIHSFDTLGEIIAVLTASNIYHQIPKEFEDIVSKAAEIDCRTMAIGDIWENSVRDALKREMELERRIVSLQKEDSDSWCGKELW